MYTYILCAKLCETKFDVLNYIDSMFYVKSGERLLKQSTIQLLLIQFIKLITWHVLLTGFQYCATMTSFACSYPFWCLSIFLCTSRLISDPMNDQHQAILLLCATSSQSPETEKIVQLIDWACCFSCGASMRMSSINLVADNMNISIPSSF